MEKKPFSPRWYSHKFRGPGLRYEVGVCCRTGWIVWAHGPFPCGEWPDLKIFKNYMMVKLDANERVIADNGYPTRGIYTIIPRMLDQGDRRMHSLIRARHEIINRRLKQWQVLGGRFRNGLKRHGFAFFAVATITQLMLEEESIPFDIADLL